MNQFFFFGAVCPGLKMKRTLSRLYWQQVQKPPGVPPGAQALLSGFSGALASSSVWPQVPPGGPRLAGLMRLQIYPKITRSRITVRTAICSFKDIYLTASFLGWHSESARPLWTVHPQPSQVNSVDERAGAHSWRIYFENSPGSLASDFLPARSAVNRLGSAAVEVPKETWCGCSADSCFPAAPVTLNGTDGLAVHVGTRGPGSAEAGSDL